MRSVRGNTTLRELTRPRSSAGRYEAPGAHNVASERGNPLKGHFCVCSYLERLQSRLEAFVVPPGSLEDSLNYSCRKRCICHLQGMHEKYQWEVKWSECEVASHSMRRWVRNMQPAEASINYAEVCIWVTPATQSAHGIRVLPERRFMEVRCIYVEMRSLKGKEDERVLPIVQFQYGSTPI